MKGRLSAALCQTSLSKAANRGSLSRVILHSATVLAPAAPIVLIVGAMLVAIGSVMFTLFIIYGGTVLASLGAVLESAGYRGR